MLKFTFGIILFLTFVTNRFADAICVFALSFHSQPVFVSAGCTRDVIFILDSSGSISQPAYVNIANWKLELSFISTLVTNALTISPYWDQVCVK